MNNCIFCKIINGKIPCQKVYENSSILAFNDISPKAPTHILVIPKKHTENIHNTNDPSILMDIMSATSEIVMGKGLDKDGYRVVINSGKNGGQEVPHLHLHILAGRTMHWPPG